MVEAGDAGLLINPLVSERVAQPDTIVVALQNLVTRGFAEPVSIVDGVPENRVVDPTEWRYAATYAGLDAYRKR